MSEVTEVLNNGQQAIFNFDTSKIFIRENRYFSGNITNGGLTPLVLTPGMLLGRISATQLMKVLASASVDGSQFPVGICAQNLTIAPAATASVTFCIGGDVAEEKVILDGADTLATLIDDRSIRDRIAGDTLGIKLVPTDQLTAFDNQ
jgi:hypothetical protein